MSVPSFRLKFDGPAVEAHEIDVADLAPALMALSRMVQAANTVVNGDALQLSVKVRTVGDGSFWIELVVRGQTVWKVVQDLVVGTDTEAIKKTLALIGLVGGPVKNGAITVVKKIRGRKLIGIEQRDRWKTLQFDDGETLDVEEPVVRLVYDPAFREALERVVSDPLRSDGITQVTFQGDGVEEAVSEADLESFAAPEALEDVIASSRQQKVFSIIDLSFRPNKKWRLTDGHGTPVQVDVEDRDFLARVTAGQIRFASDDLLVCDVIETSRRTPKGLRSDYSIVRVLEHRRGDGGPAQGQLDF